MTFPRFFCLAPLIAGNAIAAVPLAPGGYANDFTTAPASPADFSTFSIAGASGDIGSNFQMDAAIQTLAAAGISSALGTSSTYVPSTNALARHNTNASGLFLQTRPTGNRATLLMATVANNTGVPITNLAITYDLGRYDENTSPALKPEQVDGHRFYYSTTGAAGTWTAVGNFTNPALGSPLAISIDLVFPAAIAPGGIIYLLWADDNGVTTNSDNSLTLDNLKLSPHSVSFIGKSADWKYRDSGVDPGAAWTGVAFDDSAWSSGPAELGYGDDPASYLLYGPDANNKFVTTWFRKSFNVANAAAVTSLAANLKRDDGAVIYLNGTEVARSNMPAGAVTPATLATASVGGTDEDRYFNISLSPSSLVTGNNVIAVEIHQSAANSSDLAFDLELTGTASGNIPPVVSLNTPAGPLTGPVDLTLSATASDTDDGIAQVEFYRDGVRIGSDAVAPFSTVCRNLGAGTYQISARAIDARGATTWSAPVAVTVGSTGTTTTLLAAGNVWKYLDDGSNQGSDWTFPSFHENWAAGPAKLGYSDAAVTTVGYGADALNKFPTTWFRNEFTLRHPETITALTLNLLRDDGAVIYLNGVELARSNMPAGVITSATLATAAVSGAEELAFNVITVDPALLIEGRNVIAAEIHQSAANSSDLGFDMSLVATSSPSGSLTRGPYLQQAAPASMVVRWRSSLAVAGRVTIGPSPGVVSQTFDEVSPATDHSVKLTGLLPDTTYFYSVGSPGEILAGGDATQVFTTPPVAGTAKNTRLWVLGDAGTDNSDQRNVRDAFYNFTGSRTPDLCLLLGDNAYNAGTDAEYQAALFDTYSAMLRKSPFWSCLGNHETNQSTAFVDTYPYFDIFTFPTNGEAGGTDSGTEHYYSFDYGNIHFISLDSMTVSRAPGGAMATWLANDLASTTATWIIAFFHHPPYTKGSHNSDTETPLIEMRQNILPILENGGVDLVLNGHSHCYERSFLLDGHYGLSGTLVASMKKNPGDGRPAGGGAYVKPLTGPRDHFGAVYNVTGSAGQATSGTMDHPAMFFSALELGSVVLDINGTRLDSTFLRDNGTIRDTYTILKQGEADSDADGMADAYEVSNSLDRHNPADAPLDKDGDGTRNLDEFIFGRPAATADVYSFTTTVDSATGTATVVFPTVTGRNYRVYWSHTLLASDWQTGSPSIPGTGANVSWTDNGPAAPRKFYKIQASTPPG